MSAVAPGKPRLTATTAGSSAAGLAEGLTDELLVMDGEAPFVKEAVGRGVTLGLLLPEGVSVEAGVKGRAGVRLKEVEGVPVREADAVRVMELDGVSVTLLEGVPVACAANREKSGTG